MASLGQLEHAPPADVGIAIGLCDLLAMAGDVVQDQPFSQRQVTQRDLISAEPTQNLIEQNRAGDRKISTAWLEPWHPEALFEVQRGELFAYATQRLRRNASAAQRSAFGEAVGGGGDRAEAQDGARRTDHAVEPGLCNLIQMFAQFGFDMTDELSLVPRLERIGSNEPLRESDDAELVAAAELDCRTRAARDLNAASADVDDNGNIAWHADAVDRREVDEARFLCPRDHAWPYPGLLGHRLQELAAVFRL